MYVWIEGVGQSMSLVSECCIVTGPGIHLICQLSKRGSCQSSVGVINNLRLQLELGTIGVVISMDVHYAL